MTMLDWLFGRKRQTAKPVESGADVRTTPSVGSAFRQPLTTDQGTAAPDRSRGEPVEPRTAPVIDERLESQLDNLNQQIASLVEQTGKLQGQLDRLDHRTSFESDQLETLTHHLSDVAGWADPLDRQLADLVTWAEQSREALAQLEEGIRKLSRTQFKANSLAEAQQERLRAALETLQDLATRKQEDIEKAWQQQRAAAEAARREARIAMAIDLFPALDGLESALERGRAFANRSRPPAVEPGFLTRLAYAFGLRELPRLSEHHLSVASVDAQTLAAWLDGLELVRERFLTLLQAEGIQPIRAEGRLFDPHRHLAIEAVERSDVPAGTVIEEHRPGYRLGDRILRYAEVVVTRDGVEPPGHDEQQETQEPVVEELGVTTEDLQEPEATREAWGPATEEWEEAREPDEQTMEEAPETWEPEEPEAEERTLFDKTQDIPEGGAKEDVVSDDTRDDRRTIDPEIEEMIARFEERRRARRS